MCGLEDLLRRLAAEPSIDPEAIEQLRRWAGCRRSQQITLTLNFPGIPGRVLRRWLGLRLVCWTSGPPAGRRVGLVSSRLGRQLEGRPQWFAALRAACSCLETADVLLTAPRTAADRFVRRAAELFKLPLLELDVPERPMSLDQWLDQLAVDAAGQPGFHRATLSPRLDRGALGQGELEAPLRDRAVVALSDQLRVLYMRRSGHLHRLVTARLADGSWPAGSVLVAVGRGLVAPSLAQPLINLGALGWVVPDAAERAGPDRTAEMAQREAGRQPAPVVALPSAADWPYLTHCTRACHGPWPGQSETEYLDDLILGRPNADHSPLAALRRIVQLRRLASSSAAIRGKVAVVSFTAVPLAELPRLHVFRSHRGRWDFEPYGICIRRRWLEARGARPVVYGDEQTWQQLDAAQRPFFQRQASRTGTGRLIDWSVEREWRVVGDVDLGQLPASQALVFVPNAREAAALRQVSPWPVTVLQERP